MPYQYTAYFENEVLRKRRYLTVEICQFVIENAEVEEVQDDGRIRYWAEVEELNYRVVRVVTLSDRSTIHNAFIDSGFKK